MRKFLLLAMFIYFLPTVAFPLTGPCGFKVTGLKYGNKQLGLELSDGSTVVDDDGMLSVALAASYCDLSLRGNPNKFAMVKFEDLPEKTCISDYQLAASDEASMHNQIYRIQPGFIGTNMDAATVKALDDKCKIDLPKLYEGAKQTFVDSNISCAPKVSSLIKKAAQRYRDYVGEQKASPQFAARSDAEKVNLENTWSEKQASLDKISEFMNKSSLTGTEFSSWLEKFVPLATPEVFQVVTSTEATGKETSNTHTMVEILRQFESPILPRTRPPSCGDLISPSIDKVVQGAWTVGPAGVAGGNGSGNQ